MDVFQYIAQQTATSQPVVEAEKPASAFSSLTPFIMMVVVFGLMWFLMIRPQRKEEKRKKEMLGALKKGDAVVTTAGIIGTVASVKEETVVLNVGGTKVEFLRSAISSIRGAGKEDSK
ncbi:MAG: preprotein translocase subunit YajC [Spirochaetia bacterium]|nr:preprotein translocase subunit YajC [Spirochaetia bacterium]